MAKRLRILAGPNGSGKTSIYNDLRDSFHWGVFVNADNIESTLKKNGEIDLSVFGVVGVENAVFEEAFNQSSQAQKSTCTLENVQIEDDVLSVLNSNLLDSYFAAFVASFIQIYLLEIGISFSIETVMSHPSKLEFMRMARGKGYRIYLYYVSTQSSNINVGRVRQRVAEGGHNVSEDKIHTRYIRSLEQLLDAIKLSDRAYLFDNSGQKYQWVAEYNSADSKLRVSQNINWVNQFVLNKLP